MVEAAFSSFLSMHLFLVYCFFVSECLHLYQNLSSRPWSARLELKFHRLLLWVLAAIPIWKILGPDWEMTPFIKGEALGPISASAKIGEVPEPYWVIGTSGTAIKMTIVDRLFVVYLVFALVLGVCSWLRGYLLIRKIAKKSFLFKRSGRVRIFGTDRIDTPMAFSFSEFWVFIPSAMLLNRENLKMILRHEFQHLRQKDTWWIHGEVLFAGLWAWNPFYRRWRSRHMEVQERACDENVLEKSLPGHYGRMLVNFIESQIIEGARPGCATGMAFSVSRKTFTRRIYFMFKEKTHKKWAAWLMGFAVLTSATAMGAVSSRLVETQNLSWDQAKVLEKKMQEGAAFPIEINDLVFRQLNRMLNPKNKTKFKGYLKNMELFKQSYGAIFTRFGAPQELLAVGFVESGFVNLPQKPNSRNVSAGVWQFIPGTARKFDLEVSAERDDRLNVSMATTAALRYLFSNKYLFNDWRLSIMAYNMGEKALENAIAKAGTRDPWKLIRAGYENDQNYLARVMAGLVIIQNPELVDN